jgi:hypothetical protein
VKKTLGIVGLVGVGLCAQYVLAERENNSRINPEVYEAFRRVEKERGITIPERYPAEDAYDDIVRAGVKLPSFYEPGYEPKVPWLTFWKAPTYRARAGTIQAAQR